ncbi:LysR family transcriptional regulator [Xylophilus rhododendri]|uniref:LysR family transcriptional regulator n=1 Tax=Xylophilus rhododendri TaxID=2697032 RepID=A0A857JC82_9BURK|nr:LysR family transcriptional regulator [Xylophilus rhododendri]QHJ01278.1 LysR family transcriptional regulator [Xylophilus rhododendri]
MQFSLKAIECFVALFEERSVTQAAQRLKLGQPAVSMQLRRFEDSCGMDLFERDSRGFVPTPHAERLYPECLALLLQTHRIDLLLADPALCAPQGISIGVSPLLGRTVVPHEVLPLHDSHPQLKISLREGDTAQLAGWVESRKVDFAIVDVDAAPLSASTELRTLAAEPVYLVTGSPPLDGHGGGQTPLCELAAYKLALPPAADGVQRTLRTIAGHMGLSLVCGLEADSVSTLLDIAGRPGWATVLPGSVLRSQAPVPSRHASRIVEPRIVHTVGVLSRKGHVHSAAEQWFTRRMQQTLLRSLDGAHG